MTLISIIMIMINTTTIPIT